MFLGMEHLALCNYGQANDAFRASRSLCDSDPLLLNELGVLAYQRQKYVTHQKRSTAGQLTHE